MGSGLDRSKGYCLLWIPRFGWFFNVNILCSSPPIAAIQLTSIIWPCSLVDQTTDRNESKKGYGHELLYLLANKKAPHKKIIKSPHRVVTQREQWGRTRTRSRRWDWVRKIPNCQLHTRSGKKLMALSMVFNFFCTQTPTHIITM